MSRRYTVNEVTGCHVWNGPRNDGGYGTCSVKGVQIQAHRLAYIFHIGSIPPNKNVMHKCDNPPCVNPDHLTLGTNLDNVRDRQNKGRQAKGERMGQAKLTSDQVAEIRASTEMVKDIAAEYGLGRSQVSKIRNGRKWKHTLPDDFDIPPVRRKRSSVEIAEAVEIREQQRAQKRAERANEYVATGLKGGNAPGENHSTAKLTEAQAREILASTEQGTVLAVRYGISVATVSKIRTGRLWKHLRPDGDDFESLLG